MRGRYSGFTSSNFVIPISRFITYSLRNKAVQTVDGADAKLRKMARIVDQDTDILQKCVDQKSMSILP